jgi:hypothetical protein
MRRSIGYGAYGDEPPSVEAAKKQAEEQKGKLVEPAAVINAIIGNTISVAGGLNPVRCARCRPLRCPPGQKHPRRPPKSPCWCPRRCVGPPTHQQRLDWLSDILGRLKKSGKPLSISEHDKKLLMENMETLKEPMRKWMSLLSINSYPIPVPKIREMVKICPSGKTFADKLEKLKAQQLKASLDYQKEFQEYVKSNIQEGEPQVETHRRVLRQGEHKTLPSFIESKKLRLRLREIADDFQKCVTKNVPPSPFELKLEESGAKPKSMLPAFLLAATLGGFIVFFMMK